MMEPLDRWASFRTGALELSPVLLGVIPFAMIYGVLAVQAGLAPLPGAAMSLIVYAGAAQLAILKLMGDQSPIWVIVLTAWVINLRFAMYSASLAPHFRDQPLRLRMLLGWLVSDQGFAITMRRFLGDGRPVNKVWYYLGASILMWFTYVSSTAAGVLVGAALPDWLGLDFAVPLTFLALISPAIKNRFSAGAAVVSAVASVALAWLPYNLGLLCGALAGISFGAIWEGRGA